MRQLVLLILFTATSAQAAWNDIPSSDFSLRPPPRAGSAAEKKDFEMLLKYQEERTPEQCALARRQRWPNYSSFYANAPVLTQDEYLNAEPLMKRVTKFSERVAVYIKKQYRRPRPYDTDARIKPCAEKPAGSTSYPSSHATVAYATACVLAEIYPAKEVKLEAYGEELGELRAVVGVHHPSDIDAAHILASDICERLKSEPDFKKEVRELRE